MDAPQGHAWWFIAGDIVHKATEECDLQGDKDPNTGARLFTQLWNARMRELTEQGVRFEDIKAGGRKTTALPFKENADYWVTAGPNMVAGWINHRNILMQQGWDWYRESDDHPAIELPVDFVLNKDTDLEVKVKGYIDRVMVDPNGQVHVKDLKSGSREPESNLQLGVYALGVADNYGVTPTLGSYYMTRKNAETQPVSLTKYTPEIVGEWFGKAKVAIENEVFIPRVSSFCNSCSVAPYCAAQGGSDLPLRRNQS